MSALDSVPHLTMHDAYQGRMKLGVPHSKNTTSEPGLQFSRTNPIGDGQKYRHAEQVTCTCATARALHVVWSERSCAAKAAAPPTAPAAAHRPCSSLAAVSTTPLSACQY